MTEEEEKIDKFTDNLGQIKPCLTHAGLMMSSEILYPRSVSFLNLFNTSKVLSLRCYSKTEPFLILVLGL